MAHISIQPIDPTRSNLFINGVEFSKEVFRGSLELVEVPCADPEFAEVGLRVTFAVSRLDLGEDVDVQVTDRLREVAQRVRSVPDDEAEGEESVGEIPAVLRDIKDILSETAARLARLERAASAGNRRRA